MAVQALGIAVFTAIIIIPIVNPGATADLVDGLADRIRGEDASKGGAGAGGAGGGGSGAAASDTNSVWPVVLAYIGYFTIAVVFFFLLKLAYDNFDSARLESYRDQLYERTGKLLTLPDTKKLLENYRSSATGWRNWPVVNWLAKFGQTSDDGPIEDLNDKLDAAKQNNGDKGVEDVLEGGVAGDPPPDTGESGTEEGSRGGGPPIIMNDFQKAMEELRQKASKKRKTVDDIEKDIQRDTKKRRDTAPEGEEDFMAKLKRKLSERRDSLDPKNGKDEGESDGDSEDSDDDSEDSEWEP